MTRFFGLRKIHLTVGREASGMLDEPQKRNGVVRDEPLKTPARMINAWCMDQAPVAVRNRSLDVVPALDVGVNWLTPEAPQFPVPLAQMYGLLPLEQSERRVRGGTGVVRLGLEDELGLDVAVETKAEHFHYAERLETNVLARDWRVLLC